jgi:GMC oxidoreductase
MKKNIVVIGSGLAGSLICNELAETANVTLLERGPKDVVRYPHLNFIKKRLASFNTFCFSGGGGSNLWHNGLIPIHNKDVTSKEFSELLEDAQPYMDKAATNLFFPAKSFKTEYRETLTEMNRVSDKVGIFDEGVDCLIYPKKYKKLTIDSRVAQHYLVDNIDFKANGRRITEVEFSVGQEKKRIITDTVIICGGTFGSPRLVTKVLSAIGQTNSRIGRGLIDHPAGFVGKVRFNREISDSIHKFALLDKEQYEACTGARLKSACGQYTCFAFFRPAITMSNRLSVYQYKSKLGGSSGIDRIKNAFSFKLFHPDILIEILSHVFGITIRSRTFNILVYFQQRRGDNNVSYDGEQLNIDWDITAKEIEIYKQILAKLDATLTPFADDLNIQSPITEEWLRSGAHHSGTISLGDGEDDLIDCNLQIKCCDNAFVCDGSVIQEHSYANTGLTIGQLALRLANKLSSSA